MNLDRDGIWKISQFSVKIAPPEYLWLSSCKYQYFPDGQFPKPFIHYLNEQIKNIQEQVSDLHVLETFHNENINNNV